MILVILLGHQLFIFLPSSYHIGDLPFSVYIMPLLLSCLLVDHYILPSPAYKHIRAYARVRIMALSSARFAFINKAMHICQVLKMLKTEMEFTKYVTF